MKKVKEITIEDKLKKEIKELKDDAKPYVAYKKLILNVAKAVETFNVNIGSIY